MKLNNKYIIVLLLVIIILGGCSGGEEVVAEEIYVPVETMEPIEGNISRTLTFTGEIRSEDTVMINPMIMSAEEALEVLVKVGEYVEKDQVLAVLSGDNTSDQVESARLGYELAKSSYNAQYENYNNAVENFEKIKILYEAGAVSKSEYDGAKIRASGNQLDLLRDQLNQAKFAYENASGMLDDLNITSPVNGIVSEINISKNNLVSQQNTITVLSIDNLEVVFYVPEGKIGIVKPGMNVSVNIPSIDTVVNAKVDWINPQKDPMKNMYKGSLLIDNTEGIIYPGMKAFVDLKLTNDKTYLLPIDAILLDEEYFVYVIQGDKAIMNEVVIGEDDGEVIEILSGLSGEEQVIVKGQNFVKEDTVIKVVRGQ